MHLSFFEAGHAILKCQIELNQRIVVCHCESTCTFPFEKRTPPVLINQIELNKGIADYQCEGTCTFVFKKHAFPCVARFPCFLETCIFVICGSASFPDSVVVGDSKSLSLSSLCAFCGFGNFSIFNILRFLGFLFFLHFVISTI